MSKSHQHNSETLLHGEFGVYPSKGIRYALSLTQTGLHIQRLVPKPEDDQRTVLPITDMVGCHTLRNHGANDIFAYFSIYSYPMKKKKVAMGSTRTRQRLVRTFRVDEAPEYEKNQVIAEKWATAIKCLIQEVSISSDMDITSDLLPRSRRLLLLLNPCGGRGNALQQCHTHILPIITEADISYNLIQTERQNHARELVQTLNLEEWDGIVVISGDGLLYEGNSLQPKNPLRDYYHINKPGTPRKPEVINGLMERADWEDAIKMPIGILPCGSGNALAGAVNYNAGKLFATKEYIEELLPENYGHINTPGTPRKLEGNSLQPKNTLRDYFQKTVATSTSLVQIESLRFDQAVGSELLLNCILLLCRGTVMPMDLVSVTTCSGTRCFSFLSIAWGFISDVDIESEKYRHMGSARFTVGTMVRVASLRTYQGRLSYLPVLDAHRPICRSITLSPDGNLAPLQRSQLHRTISDMGLCEERNVMCKRSSAALDTGELPSFETSPSPGSPSAVHTSRFTFDTVPNNQSELDHGLPTKMQPVLHNQVNGPRDDLLPSLSEPLPMSWVTVEGEFVLVLGIYQTHLGADLFTAPFSYFDDGLIHLFFVKAGISRTALVRLFLAMEKGTHVGMECPHLVHVPVRAFRLEPLTRKGIITVDGEQVEYGPIQAQVHGGLGNIITGCGRVRMTSF